jgi:hypothetical protein
VAITNGYCTLSELKARLTIDTLDTQDDAMLEACIEGASRQVDAFTGTRFYQASETRYYTALDGGSVAVDDCTAVSALAQDLQLNRSYSDTFTTDDYELAPDNATLAGKPYQQILLKPLATKGFLLDRRAIKVTGTFGYAASAPPAVKQATMLLAAALFRRKDAPFGIAGGGEVGQAIQLAAMDPQAKLLLMPFRRLAVMDLV